MADLRPYGFAFGCALLLLSGCSDEGEVVRTVPTWDGKTLFEPLQPSRSGIDFANDLQFNEDFNIYTYRNFYNGGGVAIGDVNNDGLADIYLSGNQVPNRLYLNRGDMAFEDVTETAGVGGDAPWSTGVTMADVNADGWLDIYVCNSGDVDGNQRQNELFINQKDGTFLERAQSFGLANDGLSTHGVFFDYDRDGDLDFYLLNNSYQAIGSFNLERNVRPVRDSVGGDRLYQNRDGRFHDVSEEAGIYGSVIGFGLGVTVGDVDKDGWPDIFVSNDFFERDYLYMNQGDGTFRETLTTAMRSISYSSMGADMADIDNDGYSEIFVTEMLPSSNQRQKEATTFENWNRYQYNVKNDYYHQFTRNVLHRNNRDGTFTEIGRLSGVEATDWSWGALIMDLDNDGNKDIFVANGIYQDLTNRDFLDYIADSEFKRRVTASGKVDFKVLVDAIPSTPSRNFAFRNLGREGNYTFQNVAAEWGLDQAGFSNGAAYGDLDNDGDLDLVINNTNAPATIYRNHTSGKHWLQLRFKGTTGNPFGVGAKATAFAGDQQWYLEHMPMRGFESSMQYRLHFGIGDTDQLDSLVVEWPDGKVSRIVQPVIDQLHLLDHKDASVPVANSANQEVITPLLSMAEPGDIGIDFVHKEQAYNDFDRDPLIYQMLSAEGPALCSADFNRDGRQDFYLGGARNEPGALYYASGNSYRRRAQELLEADRGSEDVACACFDADGDGDQDLYVVSGSSEFGEASTALFDRLYINQGGTWAKSDQILPTDRRPVAGAVVAPNDVDQDGDTDLFIGARLRPGHYGIPPDGYLLINNGRGRFATQVIEELGMVTAASWVDVMAGPERELLIVGEFMAPRAFRYMDGSLGEQSLDESIASLKGWYTAMEIMDVDGDGREDIALGNHGLNSRFKATPERPVMMHVNDFDANGSAEQIMSMYEDEEAYPLPLLHDLIKQMPGLRKRYIKYAEFGDQTMTDIFGETNLNKSIYYEATEFRSYVLLNKKEGLVPLYLPWEAQQTPVYALMAKDFNGDGRIDLLVGGNSNYVKPEMGRYDAGRGLILLNTPDEPAGFRALSAQESGLRIEGDIRGFAQLGNGRILVARNNLPPIVLTR